MNAYLSVLSSVCLRVLWCHAYPSPPRRLHVCGAASLPDRHGRQDIRTLPQVGRKPHATPLMKDDHLPHHKKTRCDCDPCPNSMPYRPDGLQAQAAGEAIAAFARATAAIRSCRGETSASS